MMPRLTEPNSAETITAKAEVCVDEHAVERDENQLSFAFAVEPVSMTAQSTEKEVVMSASAHNADLCSSHGATDLGTDKPVYLEYSLPESLGSQLRASREVRGWSAEEAANKLHLPLSVVNALENDAYERIGHDVYLRGYLQSYLRLLDLPQILSERILAERDAEQPLLVTTGTISHSRYLFQRYSVPVVYLVLTALIGVPMVWLAWRGNLDQNISRVAPLDAPMSSKPSNDSNLPPSETSGLTNLSAEPANDADSRSLRLPAGENAPLLASMSPFPVPAATFSAPTSAGKSAPFIATAPHTLRLTFTESSWVEILDSDGKRLEYGMLAAGRSYDFSSEKPLTVRIGNTNGVVVEADGKSIDVEAYRHANVAHFKLFSAESAGNPGDY